MRWGFQTLVAVPQAFARRQHSIGHVHQRDGMRGELGSRADCIQLLSLR